MSLVANTPESDALCKNSADDVTTVCIICSKSFLAKYWDDELDWYIELNVTDRCRECQQSDPLV